MSKFFITLLTSSVQLQLMWQKHNNLVCKTSINKNCALCNYFHKCSNMCVGIFDCIKSFKTLNWKLKVNDTNKKYSFKNLSNLVPI